MMNKIIIRFALVLSTIIFQLPLEATASLQFVENKGQWEESVLAKSSLKGGQVFIQKDKLVFDFHSIDELDHVHHMKQHCKSREDYEEQIIDCHAYFVHFEGANPNPEISKERAFPGTFNYFLGNDKSKWQGGCRAFEMWTLKNLYDNIDLTIYSEGTNFKYDFILHPGANPEVISLRYEGQNSIDHNARGELEILTSINKIKEQKPYIYQLALSTDKRIEVTGSYLLENNLLRYDLGEYDSSIPLVIDPQLIGATYSGISGNDIYGFTACYDQDGNIYSGGEAFGSGLPTTPGAYQTTYGGGFRDMALNKFNQDASVRIYSTYIGGSGSDYPQSTIVDDNDMLVVYGNTTSSDFPITAGAFSTVNDGSDIAIAKLSSDGTALIASTFIGGSANDGLNYGNNNNYGDTYRGEVNIDADNNILVVSCTDSNDFPTTATAVQTSGQGSQDAIAFSMSADLTSMNWGTYLGGSSDDSGFRILQKNDGTFVVVGGTKSSNFPTTPGVINETYQGGSADGFLTHLNADASSIIKSSFSGTNSYDQLYFADLNYSDELFIMGQTDDTFPVSPGVYFDYNGTLYICKMLSDWSDYEWSTRIVNNEISPTAFLIDVCENIYVSGFGYFSGAMAITPDAFQPVDQSEDFYFEVLDKDAQNLIYASFFGGSSSEHVDGGTSRFDKRGVIYQGICTSSSDVPGASVSASPTLNAYWDVAVFKFDFEQVNLDAEVEILINGLPGATGCAPLEVDFTNVGFGGITYDWDFGDGIGFSNDSLPTYIYTEPGEYLVSLVLQDPSSCLLSDTAFGVIEVFDSLAIAEFVPDQFPNCNEMIVDFTNNSLSANIFSWDFGDGMGTSTAENPTYVYDTPGTYTVTLIASDSTMCAATDSVSYDINYTVIPDQIDAEFISNDDPDCDQMLVDFTNNSLSANEYFWDFGDGLGTSTDENPSYIYGTQGSYVVTLIASDSTGCFTPDTINYTLSYYYSLDQIDAVFTNTETGDCDILDVIFANSTSNADTWLWDFGDGIGTSIAENPNYTYSIPGTYTVTLTASNSNGCQLPDETSAIITYSPDVIPTLILPEGLECLENGIQFDAPVAAAYYEWAFGDGNFSSEANPLHMYENPGSYQVDLTVIDSSTCNIINSASTTVEMITSPDPLFTLSTDTADLNEVVIFNFPNNSNVPNFEWNFDDGSTNSSAEVSEHFFNQTGEYEICLTIATENGCPASHCERLIVETEAAIGVPNAFSPNGDGQNDILYVRGFNVLELNFKLFNRWGELVFETEDLDAGWDGIYKGQAHEMDVFAYLLNARLTTGEIVKDETGNITLLR